MYQEFDHIQSSDCNNALTIDVEEYFQVSAFEKCIDRSKWSTLPSRVDRNINVILDVLDASNVKATFFILGWIAERHPKLIRKIHDNGHEIACHGLQHVRVNNQNIEQFKADVVQAKNILEDVISSSVKGYRAASFSINDKNIWALDVLKDNGFAYSSSINPIRHDLYGMPDAPRFPFKVKNDSILEIPISTVRMIGRNWPCGGGGFFRILPYKIFRAGLKKINQQEKKSAIFYFHPWEIDAEQPRVKNAPLKSSFRHYHNLHKTLPRLKVLLSDFNWGRVDQVYSSYLA
ncbi:MAG: XrtA system polysaccharide deacetylase [Pseudomonadota bacterium]